MFSPFSKPAAAPACVCPEQPLLSNGVTSPRPPRNLRQAKQSSRPKTDLEFKLPTIQHHNPLSHPHPIAYNRQLFFLSLSFLSSWGICMGRRIAAKITGVAGYVPPRVV